MTDCTFSGNSATGSGGGMFIGNIDADPLFVDPGFWENNGTPGILGRRIVIQDKQLRSSEYLDTTRYAILASARIGGSTQYFATTVAT